MVTIAIVGKPNVGKSTLFNKLIGRRQSIVHHEAGVTRDRIYGTTSWTGHHMKVIDTGGVALETAPFQEQIQMQVEVALTESDIILLVVDGRAGITNDDRLVLQMLHKSNKKVIVVANKIEGHATIDDTIWKLGISDLHQISAMHGSGIGDLLDAIIASSDGFDQVEDPYPKIAIIGRPNVGKSSLLNLLAKTERAIVSPQPGTTRDALNTNVTINDKMFTIVDTAGINRKSKLIESVDHYALARSIQAIKNADIVVLMIDWQKPLTHFDAVVAGYIDEYKKAALIVVNKCDLTQEREQVIKDQKKLIRNKLKFIAWAPLLFISVHTQWHLINFKKELLVVEQERHRMIKTSTLNDVFSEIQIIQPAQSYNGGKLRIKFIKQVEAPIPTFIMWVNNTKYLHFTYQRFLHNKLREYFGLSGVPIALYARNSQGGHDGHNK